MGDKTESSKEKRQHSTVLIPYSYYECRIPDYFMNVPMHWHSEFEINYVLDGTGEFICGDDKFVAHKGDIFILPPNMLHAVYSYHNCVLAYDAFVFSSQLLNYNGNERSTIECIRPVVKGFSRMKSHITESETFYLQMKEAINQIRICVANNNAMSDLLIKSELLRIFWILESNHFIQPYAKDRISYTEIIRPAIAFMNDHYNSSITIEQLSEQVNLSKSYFMNCFRRAVGVSAIEYLVQLRIKAACEMLRDTKESVAEIAFHCGFNNLSNFNRQFRKIVGRSPLEFRNEK